MNNKQQIATVLMEGKVRHLMVEGEDITIMENLVSILQPFQKATEALSTEQYPSISTVKPLLFQLMEKTLQEKANDDSTCKKVKKEIKSDLAGRYQDSAVQRVINVTAFLDPRYKELPFLSVPEREAVMEQVEDELIAMYTISRDDTEKNEPEESAEGEPPMKQAKKGPVADLLGDLFAKDSLPQRLDYSEKVRKELLLYKAEQPAELDSDPLQWWQNRRLAYPQISALVQRKFSITATSVPSERLFSSAGMIISSRRNSLLPSNADKLIFLFENSH